MTDNTIMYVHSPMFNGKVAVICEKSEVDSLIESISNEDPSKIEGMMRKITIVCKSINIDCIVRDVVAGDEKGKQLWKELCGDLVLLACARFVLYGEKIVISHTPAPLVY
jgi:hypothetical protein